MSLPHPHAEAVVSYVEAISYLANIFCIVGQRELVSMALLGLGKPDLAEQELRAAFKQAEHYGDLFLIDYVRLHLAFLLSGSASQSLEAAALAREQLNSGVANSLHTSMSHAVLSRVAAKNRVFSEALAEAERAYETLHLFPPYWFFVAPAHIHALLQLQRPQEALQIAEEMMAALERIRSGGINEIAVRLAYAQALLKNGKADRSRAALSAAEAALMQRASKIPTLENREKYLRNVLENAELLKLVRGL